MFCFANTVGAIPDAEQPVKIQSDNASLDHENGLAVYNGNVIVDQGSRHLCSDKLTIKRNANNKIEIMIATGKPATFSSQEDPKKPQGSGEAMTIKYYPQKDQIDLLDEATITKDGDTITGPILNYNLTTGNLKTTSSGDKRVTFILQPKRES